MQLSTEKNKAAIDTMTREILSTCRNQDDIDEWFSEVTQDPKYHKKPSRSDSETERRTPTDDESPAASVDAHFINDFDSAAWEDFSVSYTIRKFWYRMCC